LIFMGISLRKKSSSAVNPVSAPPAFSRILYRAAFLGALTACVTSFSTVVVAQEERPQINPGERKAPSKKEEGPRAIGLLRLASNGKASLLPIAIQVNGKFYDATAYKATPVPMALDSGTVYEGERTGNSLGLFTVNGGLHANAVNAESPWIGTGAWLPTGTEVAKSTLKAETVPVGIDTSDEPPRLTKKAPKAEPPAASAPASQPTTPAEAKPAATKPPDPPKEPENNSGTTEDSRPRLRRGRPTQPLPDDEIPGYSRPGTAPPANAGKIVTAAAATGPVQLIPAISDASGPDPRSFTFEWLKDEEGERRQQMMDLAKQELRAYVEARAKGKITPKAPGPARRVPAKKPTEPVFGNAQMVAYDLWANNQPVLVFSAEAHIPPAPGAPSESEDLQYSILIVAHPDMYNNMRKLHVVVTDKYHLDVTPRLELIDALDADGDSRGELLFRETTDAGSGWIIYRATADKLWKMFDSLNPE
jgi:hypothetical protein